MSHRSHRRRQRHRKLKITATVVVTVLILGFFLYKASYNVLAPVLFDMVVGRNPEAFLKLGENVEPEIEPEKEEAPVLEETKTQEQAPEKEETEEPEKEEKEDKKDKKPANYETETYIGVLTTADLATVIKSISAADKTRIITICKSVVSASDMPRFARMATSGMKGDDYSFAESYLRSRLTPTQKKEIMEIVRKYLGR